MQVERNTKYKEDEIKKLRLPPIEVERSMNCCILQHCGIAIDVGEVLVPWSDEYGHLGVKLDKREVAGVQNNEDLISHRKISSLRRLDFAGAPDLCSYVKSPLMMRQLLVCHEARSVLEGPRSQP